MDIYTYSIYTTCCLPLALDMPRFNPRGQKRLVLLRLAIAVGQRPAPAGPGG